MNKQFEPLFTPYDPWLWAHPPVYAIANGGLGAIRAKTTVFIVSKCNRRHPFRVPPVVRLSKNSCRGEHCSPVPVCLVRKLFQKMRCCGKLTGDQWSPLHILGLLNVIF